VLREQMAEEFANKDGRSVVTPNDRVTAACVIDSIHAGDGRQETIRKCGRWTRA
jgi:hypothetical protein